MDGIGTSGSVTTVSKDDNLEVSSYRVTDESHLELGLGLSLGSSSGVTRPKPVSWGRILTAQDLPCVVSQSSASSSSSAGSKRPADSSPSQVVGWPPIRAYRMNSIVNQTKSPAMEDKVNPTMDKTKSKNTIIEKAIAETNKINGNFVVKAQQKTSLFVKVNMDGFPIGRKVDLNAHSCYESLAETLEDMFDRPTTTVDIVGPSRGEHDGVIGSTCPSKLLDGSSKFVITYEDKDGDWMLVGDVPWGMFLSSAKRLRIMRASEANGLGIDTCNQLYERNGRRRANPV